ncbi:hypothetical protein DRH27_01350 [Candidatus Falkowbacteria bacterium]|nr:MAG: hypothetical protein DRH27_01350 [Candidatus Falkowbacteria bacterium]
MISYFKKHITQKWLLIFLAIFFILAILLCGSFFIFEKKYSEKFYPGVHIANTNVGGLNKEQAKKLLNNKVNFINQNGIKFQYHTNSSVLFPLIASVETDLAYEIINFNIEKSIDEVYSYGRQDSFLNNFIKKIKALTKKKYFGVYYTVNENEINKFLINSFYSYERPSLDAKLVYEKPNYNKPVFFEIEEEKYGQIIDYKKGINDLKTNLLILNNENIVLNAKIDFPKIYKKDCLNITAKAEQLLSRAPVYLFYEDKEWKINNEKLTEWLALKNNPSTSSKDKIMVGLENEKVSAYLISEISPEINKEPRDAKFIIKNGRVEEFQISENGLTLDTALNFEKIENELRNSTSTKIKLVVREEKSKIETADINDMGIKEIIGIGHSNFSGSPKNRRHNIAVGAAAVNGTLIKPEEEFSLNTVLGEINAETGYLTELVIKDNKTIPEYGGGLCQIGTTMFRTTINSGLPVTMRRNHSYRVSYYEPAGTDATIYNPWPDYKFINDTPYHILIQSRIEGDNIYFDFWGTKDGRAATSTYPIIYNIARPGPTKIIETLDLAPGEKKCTEHAHNGADAYFDYKVTYSNGEIKEKTFTSHYVPWREVCLLGVEELASEKEKTATSTAAAY